LEHPVEKETLVTPDLQVFKELQDSLEPGDREVRLASKESLDSRDAQVLTVLQDNLELGEILDLLAARELLDHQDCKDFQDSLVQLVSLLRVYISRVTR